jgi:predicted ATPase/DNA-binding SARP family transcriptional activator
VPPCTVRDATVNVARGQRIRYSVGMNVAGSALQIRLFGEPQLRQGADPMGYRPPARTLPLLTYLLVHRDASLARDAVAVLFWPDLPESEARAKLRYDMRDLRAALPTGETVPWILADKQTICWNPAAPVWLDVAEFERLATDPETASAAVDIYRGDLGGRLDEEWIQAKREHFRELQSRLLYGLVTSSRARNDLRGAISYAQRLVQHDPWREDAVRILIELRHETGDRAGALQFYRGFAERLDAELGVEPMAETIAVYDRISAAVDLHELAAPSLPVLAGKHVRHNLPAGLTTFFGRDSEVAALNALLGQRRLLTLIGTGGVGKTRLAIETARTLVDRFSDGVWLVELASLADPALIVSTIASSLGLQSPSEPSLLAMLQGKRILLVLDNCEHLIAGAATVVERLIRECPLIHVLATSREPLRCVGERTERVVSLALPASTDSKSPSQEALRQSAAVRLFLDRAADVSPALQVNDESEADRKGLATIARRLDGIPLAIEFAAARTSSLSIAELAQRLDDRFSLLTAGKRTALPRQQTLRATLDWSYELLTPLEQRLLQRAGIFAGGWTIEAVSAVCSDDGFAESRVVDLLSSLVDKSLVVVEAGPADTRYRLLETTRAYALERLVEAGEAEAIARRHAKYYAAFAQQGENTWSSLLSFEALERFSLELDNYRAALGWATLCANDPELGASLIGSMRWAFAAKSLNAELVRWCDRALLALGPCPREQAEADVQLALAGSMGTTPFFPRFHYYRAAAPERFISASERAAEVLLAVGDEANRALALSLAVMHLRLVGEARAVSVAGDALAAARICGKPLAIAMALYAASFALDQDATVERTALLSEALVLARAAQSPYQPAAILHALGEVAFESGDPMRAVAYARESALPKIGLAPVNQAQALITSAAYCLALGEISEARASARAALIIARRIGEPMIAGAAFQHIAGVAVESGDLERAAHLLGASDARRAEAPPRLFTERTGYDRTIAKIRERLSEADIGPLMQAGFEWSIENAIAQAMTV